MAGPGGSEEEEEEVGGGGGGDKGDYGDMYEYDYKEETSSSPPPPRDVNVKCVANFVSNTNVF